VIAVPFVNVSNAISFQLISFSGERFLTTILSLVFQFAQLKKFVCKSLAIDLIVFVWLQELEKCCCLG
jgi:hypothetical protein